MQIGPTYMSLGNVSGLEERSYHVEFVVMPAKEREEGESRREQRERQKEESRQGKAGKMKDK